MVTALKIAFITFRVAFALAILGVVGWLILFAMRVYIDSL
jgi:hypothetical protein